MEHSKFLQLVKGGEKANVDFKMHCDAFASSAKAPKAELAKDICAMANNGGVTSYIIIGVSDDGQSFESVANTELTDERLQSFCKTAISPPVKVRLRRERWTRVSTDHAGKEFVIIQVGPHRRQAFHLARDFIDYRERVCYRRNEVWIRRESTTDLASPEEVARLVKGLPPHAPQLENNVEYQRLATAKQSEAVRVDLARYLEEVGGCLRERRAALPIAGVSYVWHWVVVPERPGSSWFLYYALRAWEYEHGVLLLARGSMPKNFGHRTPQLHLTKRWGHIVLCEVAPYSVLRPWPFEARVLTLPFIVLPRLTDTATLRQALGSLAQFLEASRDVLEPVCLSREVVDSELRKWVARDWVPPRSGYSVTKAELRAEARVILKLGARKVR